MDIEAIREAVEAGEQTRTEIAAEYGISEGYVRKLIKQYGWHDPRKRNGTKPSTKKETFDDALADEFARRKFNLIKSELGDQLLPIDEPLIVALANQYSRYVRLEGEVEEEGVTIISKKGLPYLNPKYNALQGAIKSLTTISKEFGLTIASRKRAGVSGSNREEDKGGIFALAGSVQSLSESVDV